MSWFNVWDGLKKRTCRYLLQRYLGQFLERLNLEQLQIELSNGKATLKNVYLKVEALNDIFETQGWDVEVICGHIGTLMVTVPWNAPMINDSCIEVFDMVLSLRPVNRENDGGASMLESMWSSVSSSMQLAEECMRQKDECLDGTSETTIPSIIGLEKFAETIDNVLNRIKAKFSNVILRLEYPVADTLIIINMEIQDLNYKNETDCEKTCNEFNSDMSANTIYEETTQLLPSFVKHNFTLNGFKIYTDECRIFNNFFMETANKFTNTSQLMLSKAIPILEIKGFQNLQIKIKQSEEVRGPKVSLDFEFGGVYFILTPRQIHLIIKILESFNEDTTAQKERSIDTNICNHDKFKRDFNMFGCNTANINMILNKQSIWGVQSAEIIDTTKITGNIAKEIKVSKFCESLTSSVSSNSTVTASTKLQRKTINMESCADILHFNVRIMSIEGIVLHKNILIETHLKERNSHLNEASHLEMLDVAKKYFISLPEEVYKMESSIFCKINHIFIRLDPVFAEGTQHRNKSILLLKSTITATKCYISEVLTGIRTPLISFDRSENCSDGYYKRPELALTLTSLFSGCLEDTSKLTLDLQLEKCLLELDISIYDRLSGLLGPSPFQSSLKTYHEENIYLDEKVRPSTRSSTEINILSRSIDIKLRFPIIDARPVHERLPWWKQNIRDDFLLLAFTHLNCNILSEIVKVISNEIDIFYCENDRNALHLLKTSFLRNSNRTSEESEYDYPEIKIIINSLTKCDDSKFFEENLNEFSNGNRKADITTTFNLPFSSKRECRQSDTLHPKRDSAESETILLPGNIEEINNFCNSAMTTSQCVVKLKLPIIDLILQSKQIYEVMYNRVNSDLLMWTPSSPLFKKRAAQIQSNFNEYLKKNNSASKFMDIVNEFGTSSSSGESYQSDKSINYSEENTTESIYFSTHENNQIKDEMNINQNKKALNACSIQIVVEKLTLTLLAPVRDAENHILPGQLGQFKFIADKLMIFSVNGYENNDNMGYICLQLKNIDIYHCGLIPMGTEAYGNGGDECAEYMLPTFYKTPLASTKGNRTGCKFRDTLSVVMEIKRLPEQRVKRLKISSGIQGITLRHHPVLFQQSWLAQLMDFLDVLDYEVEGYQPFGIISEVQFHLWDCAIDYRPDDFLYRGVVEIGSFSVSTNIISSVTSYNLRFIMEEAVLSIAPSDISNVKYCSSTNLVPVVDVGLLDISLLLNEKNSSKSPKMDLRCSIQDLHLRTCSDSLSALAQLILFVGSNGGIENTDEGGYTTQPHSSLPAEEPIIYSNERKIALNITNTQQERVNLMMAEAVQDTITSSDASSEINEKISKKFGTEVFYFPDENITRSETLRQIKEDLGDINAARVQSNEKLLTEDGYCIISNEQTSITCHNAIKNIEITDEPLRVVDNHFCFPTKKTDLLQTPENFPVPLIRYTLCEMTFTWHLYGGRDFAITSNEAKQSNVKSGKPQMSEAYRYGVSYSKGARELLFRKKPKEKLTWKSTGGLNRNHEVLVELHLSKVRYSHDIYPVYTTHACRQVLIINDIEIRDRLQSSEINKFLYLPKLNNVSSRNSNRMLVIKALHIRPNLKQSATQECSLRISLLPMRLHIDQETLIFLADYFTNVGNAEKDRPTNCDEKLYMQQECSKPVMVVDDIPEAVHDLRTRKLLTKNFDILMDSDNCKDCVPAVYAPPTKEDHPIFFREVIFSPEVTICFDYHGKHIELSRGPITGLLMGLGQLQCSEIRLKKLTYRRGLLGLDKLITYLCKEWLKDIKGNQLPKILSGVGPTYAFVQFFQGIYDLFWMPIEQYQKDGRIVKGLQLGAQSFSARTALAALEITARVIQLLQFTAETAFDMVSPGPSVRRARQTRKGKKKRPHRPKDIREGVANAYLIVKEGINDSANTLIETAAEEHDQKGYTGAVGAVMRHIPQLVVCPAVLATQATNNILGGVKSSLVPEAKFEAREKWKNDSD